jgi:PAS domain S-box-containing protein
MRQAALDTLDGLELTSPNALIGVAITDLDGRFVGINDAFSKITGYSLDELRLTHLLAITHPDYRRFTAELTRRLLTGEMPSYILQKECIKKTGDVIWLKNSVSLISDEEGNPVNMIVMCEDLTERKRAQDALRKQQENLQTIIDHIPLMINFFDERGGIRLVNRQWENTLGWTREEVCHGHRDVIPECYPDPKDQQSVVDFIARSSGEWNEFQTRTRDGRLIETSWATVRVSDGTVVGIGKDITQERRRARLSAAAAELAHGLSGTSSPLEAARKIVQVADDLFGWDSCNLQLYDSKRDLIQPILAIATFFGERKDVTPFRVFEPTRKWRRVIENGAELVVRKPSREFESKSDPLGEAARRPASIMVVPIRYGTNVIGLLSLQSHEPNSYDEVVLKELQSLANLCGEALNRIRAEQSLYESEERFRQIAENIDAVIWMADLGMENLLYINPAYERIWGRTVESIDEQDSFVEAVHPADQLRVEKMLERQMRGQHDSLEYRILRPDGSIRWIQRRSFPIWDAEGKAYRVAGVAEDITERKRAETEQINFSRRLIDAQESERMQIARELHDDIGQVLTAVRMSLQSLDQTSDARAAEDQVKEGIRVIDEALNRVRDLSFELRPSLLDDLGLVAATRWYVDRYARNAGINAEVYVDFENPRTRLSREVETACFRILQEALTNIARHAKAGHVVVLLTSVDSKLFLSVKDDGIGMEASTLHDRANSLSTLGLRGMEERAHAVAGRLEIISGLSLGTEVRVSLPIDSLEEGVAQVGP